MQKLLMVLLEMPVSRAMVSYPFPEFRKLTILLICSVVIENVWMVDHSSRVIAYYNGSAGGTKNTIDYARKQNIQVIEPDGIQ